MSKSRICECCKREFLEQDMRGNLCVCCYDFIEEHQDKQVEILEKALELACEDVECDVCPLDETICACVLGTEDGCSKAIAKCYLEEAKEMMKSE